MACLLVSHADKAVEGREKGRAIRKYAAGRWLGEYGTGLQGWMMLVYCFAMRASFYLGVIILGISTLMCTIWLPRREP